MHVNTHVGFPRERQDPPSKSVYDPYHVWGPVLLKSTLLSLCLPFLSACSDLLLAGNYDNSMDRANTCALHNGDMCLMIKLPPHSLG